jgi:hypothetical protein
MKPIDEATLERIIEEVTRQLLVRLEEGPPAAAWHAQGASSTRS